MSETHHYYYRLVSIQNGKVELKKIPNPPNITLTFLDNEMKEHMLARLEKYIRHAKTGEDFAGRDLKFDLELEDHVRKINQYPGMVTRSCCVGHPYMLEGVARRNFAYLGMIFSEKLFYGLSEILDTNIKEVLQWGLDMPGNISPTEISGTNYAVSIDTRSRNDKGDVTLPSVIFRVKDENWQQSFNNLILRLEKLQ